VSTSQNIQGMSILSHVHSTNHITAEIQFYTIQRIDCISWFHLNASYVLGNKIAKNKDSSFNDLGKPQFFYEIVQNWVAFELVQVLHKYGLKPVFKTNLDEWSTDIHCVVQYLKKIPQHEDEKKRAIECVDILFQPKKTEHYGSFIRCEHGTRKNFENMANFAIPLVILTWHRMIQEYFWKNGDKFFFHFGNYNPQQQRFKGEANDLNMIDSSGFETKITSFDMIRPNSNVDVSQKACLSLLEWADYLLKPHIDNGIDEKGPMMTYKITDDEINWKKETETVTEVTTETTSAAEPREHLQWNKVGLDGDKQSDVALKCFIAEALHVSHSRYAKNKRLTATQKEEKEAIEKGMLSIMQMHCKEIKTTNDKGWQETLNEIIASYQTEKESIEETDDEESIKPNESNNQKGLADAYDDDDGSDDDVEVVHKHNKHGKRFTLFGDDEDDDDLGADDRQISEIGKNDAAASEEEQDGSGEGNNIDVDIIDQREETGEATATENNTSGQEYTAPNEADEESNKKRPAGKEDKGSNTKRIRISRNNYK